MKITAKKFLFFTEKYGKNFEQIQTSSASILIKISVLIIPTKGQAK
jgi:hypothetical protein